MYKSMHLHLFKASIIFKIAWYDFYMNGHRHTVLNIWAIFVTHASNSTSHHGFVSYVAENIKYYILGLKCFGLY